jgi:hypothetical protein
VALTLDLNRLDAAALNLIGEKGDSPPTSPLALAITSPRAKNRFSVPTYSTHTNDAAFSLPNPRFRKTPSSLAPTTRSSLFQQDIAFSVDDRYPASSPENEALCASSRAEQQHPRVRQSSSWYPGVCARCVPVQLP